MMFTGRMLNEDVLIQHLIVCLMCAGTVTSAGDMGISKCLLEV